MITVQDITPEIIEFIKNNIKDNNQGNELFSKNNIEVTVLSNGILHIENKTSSAEIYSLNFSNNVLKLQFDGYHHGIYQTVCIENINTNNKNIVQFDAYSYCIDISLHNIKSSDIDEVLINILLQTKFNRFKGTSEYVRKALEFYAFISANIL